MKKTTLVFALSLLGFCSCADFEAVSQVTKFKVLAVSAEPPEIARGESTTVSILWADPKGEGRPVSFAWVVCPGWIDPTFGLSTCEPLTEPVVADASDGGDSLDLPPVPQDMTAPPGEDPDSFPVTVISIGCAGGTLPAAADLMSHRDAEFIEDLCEGGDAVSAFKTFTVSTSDDPNRNPLLARLEVNGNAVDSVDDGGVIEVPCPAGDGCEVTLELAAFMTEDSHQVHQVEHPGGPVTEDELLYVSWFSTDGEFEKDRSDSEELLGPFEVELDLEKPGEHTLWAVARDIRGGVSWETYRISASK